MTRHCPFILCISLLLISPVRAQVLQPREIPALPCLHVDSGQDTLQFPGSHARFDSLYCAIDSLLSTGRGRLGILHIGGSHVQAGHFSHQLRTDIAAATGMTPAGRGLLFPFTAMKSNAPQSYAMWHEGSWLGIRCVDREPRLPLGLSGACVETCDTAARIVLDMGSLSLWRSDTLRVLGEGTSPARTRRTSRFPLCPASRCRYVLSCFPRSDSRQPHVPPARYCGREQCTRHCL